MQPAEIMWRARSAAMLPLDWAQWKKQPAVPKPRWRPLDAASYPVHLHSNGSPMEDMRVFDLKFPLGFDFDWHRDYRNDRQVERGFSSTLNIRDTTVVSDIKYVWEPSRHQHLSALAFAANADEHRPYIRRSLAAWVEASPYLYGVHWTSSLELAERLISWSLLYPRIADYVAKEESFRDQWLDSIYLHLSRIASKLSLYSSANNHLIGEVVGLFVGSSCFDFWPECSGWRNRARKLLEREIRIQIGEDGVNREQAMSYHLFTMELFLLAYAIARKTGQPFTDAYAQRVRAMAAFVDAVATETGDLPWYGDSDDARGFVLSEDESGLEVTMQLAGLLFEQPQWMRFRQSATQAARALVPDLVNKLQGAEQIDTKRREMFPDAGLACLRSDDGRLGLLMDFGPLGFPSPAGHGHADALSLWLSIDDEYFLVDSGTYAYHSHPQWREYFRSTAAHNTVCVDGQNQSKMAGRFLWSAKANARLLQFRSDSRSVTIEAEHDGYLRLPEPVIHGRTIQFDRVSGNIWIADSFRGTGRHKIELFFHMHQDATVLSVRDGEAQIAWRGRSVVFAAPHGNSRWEVFRASENPKLGWRSTRFNQKQAIATLRIRADIDGPSTLRTHLRVNS
jgi:hypothetical protein